MSASWRVVVGVAGGLAVLVYAVVGGEYGTVDLLDQRDRARRLAAEVAALQTEVDSLRVELKAVLTDPVRQERIARERWGMVRGEKELLYLMGGPDRSIVDSVPRDSTDVSDSV